MSKSSSSCLESTTVYCCSQLPRTVDISLFLGSTSVGKLNRSRAARRRWVHRDVWGWYHVVSLNRWLAIQTSDSIIIILNDEFFVISKVFIKVTSSNLTPFLLLDRGLLPGGRETAQKQKFKIVQPLENTQVLVLLSLINMCRTIHRPNLTDSSTRYSISNIWLTMQYTFSLLMMTLFELPFVERIRVRFRTVLSRTT